MQTILDKSFLSKLRKVGLYLLALLSLLLLFSPVEASPPKHKKAPFWQRLFRKKKIAWDNLTTCTCFRLPLKARIISCITSSEYQYKNNTYLYRKGKLHPIKGIRHWYDRKGSRLVSEWAWKVANDGDTANSQDPHWNKHRLLVERTSYGTYNLHGLSVLNLQTMRSFRLPAGTHSPYISKKTPHILRVYRYRRNRKQTRTLVFKEMYSLKTGKRVRLIPMRPKPYIPYHVPSQFYPRDHKKSGMLRSLRLCKD